jgi:hypothetical protein
MQVYDKNYVFDEKRDEEPLSEHCFTQQQLTSKSKETEATLQQRPS